MANICIIPARGGSKRIPKKNIKKFCGREIISYSIELALKSELFDIVMVSTDDEEIASVSRGYGAIVPFLRSEKNSKDTASTFSVIHEVVEMFKSQGKEFDFICCLYPCAPFTKIKYLVSGLEKLLNENFDSLIPIVKFDYSIQRALKIDEVSRIHFRENDFSKFRSQDLINYYHDCGMFYWLRPICLQKFSILTDNSSYIEIDKFNYQDIDDFDDWEIAEFKYKFLKTKNMTL